MRMVVIGGVAAGMSAATRARRLDPSLEIIVLEKGGGRLVRRLRAALPGGGAGAPPRGPDRLHPGVFPARAQHHGADRRARWRPSRTRGARSLLENGERVHYDRLVVATGARPAGRGIAGRGPAARLHAAHPGGRRPADALPGARSGPGGRSSSARATSAWKPPTRCGRKGLAVTVIESATRTCCTATTPTLTEAVRKHLERFRRGTCALGCRVDAIEPGRVDGRPLRPGGAGGGHSAQRRAWRPRRASSSGARAPSGWTSAWRPTCTGVYAAGDCAEARHLVTGRPAYIPLGTTANKMGRVAGANAAGGAGALPGHRGDVHRAGVRPGRRG